VAVAWLINCKVAQRYLKVFEFGIRGPVVFECAYSKTIHVRMHLVGACLLPKHDWPGPSQTCGICGFCSRICAVWDRCVGLLVSMCLAHVLNSCIGQFRNNTNHRVPWQALFGLTFKVVLFWSVSRSRFWQIGSASICAASFAFSLLAFGGFFAPVLIKIGGE